MQKVERYGELARFVHWVHAFAFLVLVVTGMLLYVPWLSSLAEGGITRLIHRIFAVLFILMPLL